MRKKGGEREREEREREGGGAKVMSKGVCNSRYSLGHVRLGWGKKWGGKKRVLDDDQKKKPWKDNV